MKDIDLSAVYAVCDDCARSLGFVRKDKAVGVWMDECGVCRQRKPCTALHHDWNPPKKGRTNERKAGMKKEDVFVCTNVEEGGAK